MAGGRQGLARVGVVTILDVEFDATRNALGATHWIAGSNYVTPDPAQLDVILCQASDRSHVPTVLRVHRLIEDYRPELIMVVGIAGGVRDRGVAVGDVVVPDYLHYGDFRKLSHRGDQRRYYAYDPPSVSIRERHCDRIRHSRSWLARLSESPPLPMQPQVHVGDLIAGDKLLGDPTNEEQIRLLDEFSGALAIDMESVGAARAVHEARLAPDYNPRFIVVRGISDHVTREPSLSLPLLGAVRVPRAVRVVATDLARAVPGEISSRMPRARWLRVLPSKPENQEERELWRPFAAHAAAAFAAEVAESYLGPA